MNKFPVFLLFLSFSFFACDNTTTQVEFNSEINLIPQPKESQFSQAGLALSSSSQLYSPSEDLQSMLEALSAEFQVLTGRLVAVGTENNNQADIIFELNSTLEESEYEIKIDQIINVSGGSAQALASARTTLLQLVQYDTEQLVFPIGTIHDKPDASFRGLLLDLARQWHSSESVKRVIDLASFYKIEYLQLHFTDHQSYTFPSEAFPNLPTPDRHYSVEELKEWEAYSQARGVTIIPELEVPGHSAKFVEQYPEIFAIADSDKNPWIINMGNEAVYEAIDKLVGEMTAIFQATPYFHMGGDEAYFAGIEDDPKVKAYVEANGIDLDEHELYRHFLNRMNDIVKKYDKQMCIWEGFGPEGKIQIPKDIIVFEFETNRYLPDQLIEAGYTVVNTSWQPLYVVNKRKWSPEEIYAWNIWRWENWWDKAPSFEPIQLEKTPLIIGAQMCAWEQPEEAEIPSLRKRLPAFSERIWNTEENIPVEGLMKTIDQLDLRLSVLIDDDRQEVAEN